MASSITTQADLLIYTSVSDNELGRISTDRMGKDNFARFHTLAWTGVKQLLLARRPQIEEDDLDDADELKECVCYMVLYQAYEAADPGDDSVAPRRKYWWKKMRRAFATVQLSVGGTTVGTEAYGSRRCLRG
ncbi:hypothetical protein LCGC14_2682860 [marine sediment metagenome]|uniref:Uncharacterized protein n=1 Tax=marine sediment metagenome TaxID=412755 RepID=A0A0F9CCJ5_9ZZZZ